MQAVNLRYVLRSGGKHCVLLKRKAPRVLPSNKRGTR
jgi:hypothetical protein